MAWIRTIVEFAKGLFSPLFETNVIIVPIHIDIDFTSIDISTNIGIETELEETEAEGVPVDYIPTRSARHGGD